ncbi:MAG: hypothetical protein K0Q87_5349 [Neobacillus sp.]|nr:hypothetical protein [Neobacillus sp.]
MKILRNITCILILLITLMTTIFGCGKQSSFEDIYNEQKSESQSTKSEKIGNKISDKILSNIKENDSMSSAISEAKEKNKPKRADPKDSKKTASEHIDDATNKMNQSVWGGLINFLMALQNSAVVICIVMIIIGGFLAYLFRKDWEKLKKYLIFALGGPIFFLIIVYLPPLLWYFVK